MIKEIKEHQDEDPNIIVNPEYLELKAWQDEVTHDSTNTHKMDP